LVDANGPVVLFVGRLVEGKRPGDAVEALAGVRKERYSTELYLCGDGPLRQELETQARELGVDDAVTFLGHVEYDEMPKVYRSADVLVLPSRAEGLPRTVLEAFASETPVVASDLEQVAPIVEQAGETVLVGDVEGFERELRELLGDVDRRQELGRNGRQVVDRRFRWEETVSETTIVIERRL
jgi:glycosyltransferase involved in cell wall biosynthesis